jgi:alpha-L-fucosidase
MYKRFKTISVSSLLLVLQLEPVVLLSQQVKTKASNTVKPPAAFLPLPNAAQLRWHKAEQLMFVHFGLKTFYPSDDHMGHGADDPQKFLPSKFDANQWAAAALAGGFHGIVLTSKHHDGFCNWQTQTTDYGVRTSPWKKGKGDVIKEVSDACRKSGIQFGLYVSIIDKHFERFGSPQYKTYGDYYYAQLEELSKRYGRIDEYWFDGFNADDLKMDYPKIGRMIAKQQPGAVVYDSKVLVNTIPDRCLAWPGAHGGIGPDQEYRQLVNDTLRWYPNEPSIILQGNWFHNLKPAVDAKKMQDYYLSSVGYGVTALMNVAPNSDGLIDDGTIESLKLYKKWIDQLHSKDAALFKKAKSLNGYRGNSSMYAADKVNDNKYDSYFATDDNITTAAIEIELGKPQKIDGFILQEYIPLGQRIEEYKIECRVDGKWTTVFSGKKIGYKRIVLAGRESAKDIVFPVADAVRLIILKAGASPLINNFQVVSELN